MGRCVGIIPTSITDQPSTYVLSAVLSLSSYAASAGYIPSSLMIPQRRFATLLSQARSWQQNQCLYHNAPSDPRTFSLYTDHLCDTSPFPRVTTAILEVHTDEVWNMEWSHNGQYLASASKDKTAIIWRVEVSAFASCGDTLRCMS